MGIAIPFQPHTTILYCVQGVKDPQLPNTVHFSSIYQPAFFSPASFSYPPVLLSISIDNPAHPHSFHLARKPLQPRFPRFKNV